MGSGERGRGVARPPPRGVRLAALLAMSAPGDWSGRIAALLELGVALFLVVLPLPFGAVGPAGRLLLELGAIVLLALWCVLGLLSGTRLPSRLALSGVLGLLGLTALQAVPLPIRIVEAVNPRAERLRSEVEPPPAVLEAERRLLGPDAGLVVPESTLSLDPGVTASALRTGTALAALFLIGGAVATTRGIERLTLALLLSAAFQGLYGFLTLASGYDRIWNTPKLFNLDSSTGTFVNSNHYASYMSLALACGAALVLRNARRTFLSPDRMRRLSSFGAEGSRDLLLVLLLACGIGGLLTSNSRAGIALGLLSLGVTAIAVGGGKARIRLALLAAVAIAAAIPLVQLGPERLVESYLESGQEMHEAGGRPTVWRDTIGMATAFPLTGSGFGTFASVYPLFRSGEVRQFYQHAHLDLLQLAAEGGIVAVVLMALVLVPVARAIARGLAGRQGSLAPGLAAGLGAVLLHSWVDFPFHLPAIAATSAVVAGALLTESWREPTSA